MLLVAGATGFLGREICRRLAAEDHAVRGLTDAIPMEATLRDYPLRLRTVRQYAREVLGAP